ncbi:MAG: DUF3472 domain-containing protein [Pirellulales bacterium]
MPRITSFSLGAAALVLAALLTASAHAQIRVPAATAYLDPDVRAARISGRSGVRGWEGPETKVSWFGQIKTPGEISGSVRMRLAQDATSKLRLTVAGQSHEVTVTGAGRREPVVTDFGTYEIKEAGFHRFLLESLNEAGEANGDLDALLLEGPATTDAHFNLESRRNAASVHLMYPVPEVTNIAAFYCEVTAWEDPLWSFYMACGWHRGYFGMQVNSPDERRIIFSVWDSGGEPRDRDNVEDENRVKLVAKGEDVHTNDFGNEGTGGHSHLVYSWKTGEKQRFIVTAQPVDETHTVYSGFYFRPDTNEWMLISSWNAPQEGGYLRRPHSFSENFVGNNGHVVRKALYGNQWIRDENGKWTELTTARFSHDATGRGDRLDRFMGVEDGQFFLSHGGFVPGFTEYGTSFDRPATGKPPADLELPEIDLEAELE